MSRASEQEGRSVYYALVGLGLKIGTATQPISRVRSFYGKLLAIEPGGYDQEKERHQQFSDLRVEGQREVFRFEEPLISHIRVLENGSIPPTLIEELREEQRQKAHSLAVAPVLPPPPPPIETRAWDTAVGELVGALDGRMFTATLRVVNEPGGKYDGQNELEETKPLDDNGLQRVFLQLPSLPSSPCFTRPSSSWDVIYKEAAQFAVPGGVYDVQITGSRALPPQVGGSILALNLQILSGEEAGKLTQVFMFVPRPDYPRHEVHKWFIRKVSGILPLPPHEFVQPLRGILIPEVAE